MNKTIFDPALKLGEWISALKYENVPETIRENAESSLLRALCVGLAGFHEHTAEVTRTMTKEFEKRDEAPCATLFGDGEKATLTGAAVCNSILIHSRGQEDTLGHGHPGTMVIPAAIAAAEAFGKSGKCVLEGILCGYETVGILADAGWAGLAPRKFRPNSVFGAFGAAAAVSKVLGFSAGQTANALRILVSLIGGVTVAIAAGTPEWMYQSGSNTGIAVMAAMYAMHGEKGAPIAFTANNGFMSVFCGIDDDAVLQKTLEGLGKKWYTGEIEFKKFPVCMNNQTPYILARNTVDQYDIKPEDVKEVSYWIDTGAANYPGTLHKGPYGTPTQCLMSTAFNIACAIKYRANYKRFQTDYSDQALFELIDKITAYGDEKMPRLCGKIRFELNDGRVIENEMHVTSEFYNVPFNESIELMHIVAEEIGMAEKQIDRIAEAVKELKNAQSVQGLIELLDHIDKA